MDVIRASREDDISAIAAIYAHHVRHGTGTFETDAPSPQEMAVRRADVLSKALPYLVAEDGGKILGFAYCQWFKPRAAYRFSAEDSIYVHPTACGRGIGRRLMAELQRSAQAAGLRKLIAVIGDSANAASIGLHRATGFTHVGVMRSCGWKFGRWLDIVLMEKSLGDGDATPPGVPQT